MITATSVSLNKSSATIETGGTLSLTATVSPKNTTDKDITWISSDTSIATVSSSGLVTGKSEGTTTITAKTKNNKLATCYIIVKNPTFVFEEYDTGYALVAYSGNESVVTVPSTYNGKDVIVIGAGQKIGYQYIQDAFSGNTHIKKVILPNTVKTINHASFARCSSLEEVVMPNIENVGSFAFYECISMKKIILPATLENICTHAFEGCKSLNNVDFPISLKVIQDYAFSNCSSLTNIILHNNVTLGYDVFEGCNLKPNIDVPSVPYEFRNWSTGGNVYFPNFVHTIVDINDIEVKVTDLTSSSVSVMILIHGTDGTSILGFKLQPSKTS